MYIANQAEKICVLVTEIRLVSPLEEMPNFMILAIEITSICLINGLHYIGKGSFCSFCQKMHMVSHEGVSVEYESVLFFITR